MFYISFLCLGLSSSAFHTTQTYHVIMLYLNVFICICIVYLLRCFYYLPLYADIGASVLPKPTEQVHSHADNAAADAAHLVAARKT